jgi:hypothetical protein
MSQNDLNNIITRVTELYYNSTALTSQEAIDAAENIYGLTLIMVRNRINSVSHITLPLVPATIPATRYNPLEKTKVISKKMLDNDCPCECAICQDTPKYKNAVCTDCGHYYCKECWNSWMNTDRSNKNCPTCRKEMPRTTSYKGRESKLLTGPITAPMRSLIIED